jgi:hypothetical protein
VIFNVNSLNLKIMASLDGSIEPIYFLITSIAFIFLSFVQYKKSRITKETIYLSILSVFFLFSYFAIISVG